MHHAIVAASFALVLAAPAVAQSPPYSPKSLPPGVTGPVAEPERMRATPEDAPRPIEIYPAPEQAAQAPVSAPLQFCEPGQTAPAAKCVPPPSPLHKPRRDPGKLYPLARS